MDSDWATDSADPTSQGDVVFLASNGAVPWQSQKQDLIAMSTREAEFIACSEASQDAILLPLPLKHIHSSLRDSPLLPIHYENMGALTLITTGKIKPQTEHIDVS